jgi:hypothetical protein
MGQLTVEERRRIFMARQRTNDMLARRSAPAAAASIAEALPRLVTSADHAPSQDAEGRS